MISAFLIKYAEIGIKGNNRYLFEDALVRQIRYSLKRCEGDFSVNKAEGRVYVECEGDFDQDEVIECLKKVFGIAGICPVMYTQEKSFDALCKMALEYLDEVYGDKNQTFKVEARRSRKDFPMDSMAINAQLGEVILDHFPQMSVDVHHPDILLNVEVRERIYVYSRTIPGIGGIPVGTGGKALLLLSGGIDSPVAGYMIAKRGVKIDAVYFHAPPYTSDRAKQKVIDLAGIISEYAGPIRLHVINFTDIQLYIYDKCPHDELTIIMRRYMMRIAERIAGQTDCLGLVTGESIGQVASQTMMSLSATDEVCTMPVYRPLIGFDKQEIVERAQKIGSYETSILPYEDCCTIFVAKHPVTKPKLNIIKNHEKNMTKKIDELVDNAIATDEVLIVSQDGVRPAENAGEIS